nr:MAG TPA: hypothetical protein [Caudoviricetes sp.]
MNIGGVDVSEQQQQKGDLCVCRASAPTALLRREWGRRAGGCPPPRWGWGVPTFESSAQSVLSAISTRRHRCQMRRFHS